MGEEVVNLCGGPQMASTDSTQVGERLDGAYGPAGSVLRTQESTPSPDEHVTMRRSRDSLTPCGSHAILGKQSPDRSHDQVTLPVQTRSREDMHRVNKARMGLQPRMAKGRT